MKTVDEIMEQAQVFASAWSLVGGRFDKGGMLAEAEEAKAELRQMVEAALKEREGDPFAYFYHDAATAREANPMTNSTMLVLACDRRKWCSGETPLYTAPPKAQPMSESDLSDLMDEVDPFCTPYQFKEIVRAAERHHKIPGE